MVHGFLSSAPHKNVFIIVSLQAFFIMNIALGSVQATVCLSVGISCNFMLSDVCYSEEKCFFFHFKSLFSWILFLTKVKQTSKYTMLIN